MGKSGPIVTSFIQAMTGPGSRGWSAGEEIRDRIADSLVDLCQRDGEAGKHAVNALLTRIADLQHRNEVLEKANMTDPLTGAYNRAYFEKAMAEMGSRSGADKRTPTGQHFLMLIDLDKFKTVNDTHGHAAGDAVLCHVASTLSGMTRETDAVCRLGGDEFIVILRDATPDGAMKKTTQIENTFKSLPFGWEGTVIEISGSAGYAEIDPNNFSKDIVRQIDEKMYAAKEQRRQAAKRFASPDTPGLHQR